MSGWHVDLAVRAIRGGRIIAYPTEAVYGLGCDPFDAEAVTRILRLKHRTPARGLILIASSAAQFAPLVSFPSAQAQARAEASWPGPFTWIVPATALVPPWIRGQHAGVAVRVTAHPLAKALCDKAGPIVSTSANPAGCLPARDALRVRAYFGPAIDYILPGKVGSQRGPSEIRNVVTGECLRPL